MRCKTSGWLVGTAIAVGWPQSATAADLPARPEYQRPAVVMPPPGFSWTGCYVGLHIGGASDRHRYVTNVSSGSPGHDAGSHTPATVTAGGQGGCDYQLGPLVVGVEEWAIGPI